MINWKNDLFVGSEGKKFKIEELISEDKLQKRIKELGEQISKDYEGKDVVFVCILRGGIVFLTDLIRAVNLDKLTIDFMSVSSYGVGARVSTGLVKITKDLEESIEGKNVVIVEDIVDTGKTLSHLKELLWTRKPASLKICVLLDKESRREVPLKADYVGFTIEDKFVLGYGLDYDQYLRNVPYIGVANFVE